MPLSPGHFFRWGINHLDLIETIGDAAIRLPAADNFVERWGIVKPVGDAVAPAIDELFVDTVTTMSETDTAQVKAELLAALNARPHAAAGLRDGAWLDRALKLAELLLALLGK